MEARSKTKHKKGKILAQKKNLRLLIFVLLFIFLASLVLSHFTDKGSDTFASNYDECIHAAGSKMLDTYPRQCKSKSKITFNETITEPIDTSTWKRFKTSSGISLLCPPKNDCTTNEVGDSTVYGIIIKRIPSSTFQTTILRNSNFPSPKAWYEALASLDQKAWTAPKDDILPIEGTDANSYPIYVNFDKSRMEQITGRNWKGTRVEDLYSSTIYVLIPLKNSDVTLVYYPTTLPYQDTIIKTIIDSIELD